TSINYEIQKNSGVALQQSNITRWISLSSLLQSIEASFEHVRSILSTKTTAEKQKININRINIEGLRDLVVLLKTFQDVITLIQHGDRPSLHLVYVGLNKLELHLSCDDIDNNGNEIIIDDRHEAAALLHPLYRKLTYVNDYQRMKTHIFIRQSITDLYGYGTQQVNKGASVISEPVKKKHRNIEDQFIDPEEDDEININIQNPLIFWKDHRDKLPYLTKLARRLYSMPATSACVERQFSAVGLLINERRSSLNPDTVGGCFIYSIGSEGSQEQS
ncbi:unnamed protein product, partial [Rotaria magnacalcarata]